MSKAFNIGDEITFVCNGRGRGGHFLVSARVLKVNRKTLLAVELPRSYKPGTAWRVSRDVRSLEVTKAAV